MAREFPGSFADYKLEVRRPGAWEWYVERQIARTKAWMQCHCGVAVLCMHDAAWIRSVAKDKAGEIA